MARASSPWSAFRLLWASQPPRLHWTNRTPALREPPRQQALRAEVGRRGIVEAVEPLRGRRLAARCRASRAPRSACRKASSNDAIRASSSPSGPRCGAWRRSISAIRSSSSRCRSRRAVAVADEGDAWPPAASARNGPASSPGTRRAGTPSRSCSPPPARGPGRS